MWQSSYIWDHTAPSQNCIHEKTQNTLNLGNACHYSVQNFCVPVSSLKTLKNIIHYNFSCCFVWVWNLVSHTKARTHILRMFEDRVLWRIFGSKREEVIGRWSKLRNGELHIMYSSPSITKLIKSRRMKWAGHSTHGRDAKSIKYFIRKTWREETICETYAQIERWISEM